MDFGGGDIDAVLEDEGEDGDDEAVKEEIGEKTNGDGTDDEASGGSEFQKSGRIGGAHDSERLFFSNLILS